MISCKESFGLVKAYGILTKHAWILDNVYEKKNDHVAVNYCMFLDLQENMYHT